MNKPPSAPPRRAAASAWFAVVSAYQTCDRQYERLLGHFGLSTAQFEVLNAIHACGGRAQPKDIAARLLVTRANVTGLLSRLRAGGWVELVAHAEDGRARLCVLTPRARTVLQRARDASGRFIEAQCAPFSSRELTQVHGLMQRMQAHLESLDVARIAAGRRAA